jgi:xanthine/CO dehydrogenase XdhC/CoxF family maturation factor
MRDLLDILTAAAALDPAAGPAVLATVVRVKGSSYRLPGARMLIDAAGGRTGSVSGGCLEADIARRGRLLSVDRPRELVRYDGSDEDVAWGFGLGCNGSIEVLIERLDAQTLAGLSFIRECIERRGSGTLVTVFGAEGDVPFHVGQRFDSASALPEMFRTDAGVTSTNTYETAAGGRVHALLEAIHPPLPLVIFGAGHDAAPLVRAAKQLGWHVTIADRRAGYARRDRFPLADSVVACDIDAMAGRIRITPDTAAVVMTHHFPDDQLLIPMLLQSDARYVGVLGPRARTDRIIAQGRYTEDQLARLHAPVGLDIGAEGPDQVALAVVAEIIAATNQRPAGLLRERIGPIHEPPSARTIAANDAAACPAAGKR